MCVNTLWMRAWLAGRSGRMGPHLIAYRQLLLRAFFLALRRLPCTLSPSPGYMLFNARRPPANKSTRTAKGGMSLQTLMPIAFLHQAALTLATLRTKSHVCKKSSLLQHHASFHIPPLFFGSSCPCLRHVHPGTCNSGAVGPSVFQPSSL